MKEALLDRDLARLGPALEIEALSLHAVALTSRPPILYWEPATIALMRQTETWRRQGLPVYYTLDAGPNVHLIVEGEHAEDLERELSALDYVEMSLHNRPGPAAGLVAD
jgi:diphosphomevalonate decarboxylase